MDGRPHPSPTQEFDNDDECARESFPQSRHICAHRRNSRNFAYMLALRMHIAQPITSVVLKVHMCHQCVMHRCHVCFSRALELAIIDIGRLERLNNREEAAFVMGKSGGSEITA